MNLSVEYCGVRMESPLVLPSGVFVGHGAFMNAVEMGIGAITTKSVSVEKRLGNPFPRLIPYKEMGHLNSMGLPNPGIEEGSKETAQLVRDTKAAVIASIVGFKMADFEILTTRMVEASPSMIEVNLSCPNVEAEMGAKPWGTDPKMSEEAIKRVKKYSGKIPVVAKLSPNVANIVDVAKAVVNAGADGICAINSLGHGLVIDIEKKKALLGAGPGGVTGEMIFPIALNLVNVIHRNLPNIPIIGMGGVTSWQDAVAMIEVGATAVGVGTGIYRKKFGLIKEINKGLSKFMKDHKIESLDQLRGTYKG